MYVCVGRTSHKTLNPKPLNPSHKQINKGNTETKDLNWATTMNKQNCDETLQDDQEMTLLYKNVDAIH